MLKTRNGAKTLRSMRDSSRIFLRAVEESVYCTVSDISISGVGVPTTGMIGARGRFMGQVCTGEVHCSSHFTSPCTAVSIAAYSPGEDHIVCLCARVRTPPPPPSPL